MNEVDNVPEEEEKYVEFKARLNLDDLIAESNLPKIVVEEDSITVVELPGADLIQGWVEKNIVSGETDYEKPDKEDSDKEGELEDRGGGVLEDVVEGSSVEISEEKSEDFYDAKSGTRDFYDSVKYDEKIVQDEEVVSEDYEGVSKNIDNVGVEEEIRGGRSMLEIAGFRDFEAEENRKKKRKEFF
jgi:hypothetical protein